MAALSPDATTQLVTRSRTLFGFELVFPILIAAAVRSFRHAVVPQPQAVYRTGWPLTLRPAGTAGPLFGNLITLGQVEVEPHELGPAAPGEWDGLARRIQQRSKDWLRSQGDLGAQQLLRLSSQFNGPLLRRLVSRPQQVRTSFVIAYHGRPARRAMELLGAVPQRALSIAGVRSPPGLNIAAGLVGGRLHLALTYVEAALPADVAARFLDYFVEDLTAPREPGRDSGSAAVDIVAAR
jgi:hypothetical protein